MPQDEICSYCYVERLQMMQQSPYSAYDEYYQSVLETVNRRCGLSGPTEVQEIPIDRPEEEAPVCLSETKYTTVQGDTCTSIAANNNVSSAALYMGNQETIRWCSSIKPGLSLCLPLPCSKTHRLQPSDTCAGLEYAFDLRSGDVRKYNPWVSYDCDNLQVASQIYGTNICLSPQGGEHNTNKTGGLGRTTTPKPSNGYVYLAEPPPDDAVLANGTTENCGKWHEAGGEDSCVAICVQHGITHDLFIQVNPSLNESDCTGGLQVGRTYCAGPTYFWDEVFEDDFIEQETL